MIKNRTIIDITRNGGDKDTMKSNFSNNEQCDKLLYQEPVWVKVMARVMACVMIVVDLPIIINSALADFSFLRIVSPIIAFLFAGSAIGCMLIRTCRCSFKSVKELLKDFANLRFSCLLVSIFLTIDAALEHSVGLAKMVIVLVEIALISSAIKGISRSYLGRTAHSDRFYGFKYLLFPFLIACVIVLNILVLGLPKLDFPILPINAWIVLWIACIPVITVVSLYLAFKFSNFIGSWRRLHERRRTNKFPVVQFEARSNQDYLEYVLAHEDQDKERGKELDRRAYRHYVQKNRMSKSLRRKVFAIGVGVLALFCIQMIQALDSYTPSNGSLSYLSVQPSCTTTSEFYLTRDATVSFTIRKRYLSQLKTICFNIRLFVST